MAKVLLLLPEKGRAKVTLELLKWAEENRSSAQKPVQAMALQLAAALVEWSRRSPLDIPEQVTQVWLTEARRVLAKAASESHKEEGFSAVQCAAAELVAATGAMVLPKHLAHFGRMSFS